MFHGRRLVVRLALGSYIVLGPRCPLIGGVMDGDVGLEGPDESWFGFLIPWVLEIVIGLGCLMRSCWLPNSRRSTGSRLE